MPQLANILESCMLVAFGFAWPANILNTLRVKSSRGRSPAFLIIVLSGYCFGLSAKIVQGSLNYVAVFYVVNMLMVSADLFLYCHYRKKDRLRDLGA
ncbi:MAG: hypothetical protein LBJ64_01090 [Deltaproteobacteria bacterium]|jgi:lipopolysaccharide export LptBFGC system permease protein LptF|nr:hypothetical protein [Deltaproteobacteria bacterium]